jgi:3'-phosphoadenosine 5'-phosphosulfate sulfotransferase (PAPS reductase)/FAD synthetase
MSKRIYNEKYLLSFSGGRTSSYMVDRLLNECPDVADNCVIAFCNTGREHDATLDFVRQCNERWNGRVIWLEYSRADKFRQVDYDSAHRISDPAGRVSPFEELIAQRGFLPNVFIRYCTQELKVRVIKNYLRSIGWKHWTNVIGIRADEPRRYSAVKEMETKERWLNWYPLYHWGVTKGDVLAFWQAQPFDLRIPDYMGNCDLCMLKGIGKKLSILRAGPQTGEWWMRMEEKIGGRFHKNYSIHHLMERSALSPNESPSSLGATDIPCFCNTD